MMHIALSTRLLATHRGQEIRAYLSPRKPRVSLHPGVCGFVECWRSVSTSDTEDAVPVGPGVATAVVSMGKGGKRVARANTRTSGGKGKAAAFDEGA